MVVWLGRVSRGLFYFVLVFLAVGVAIVLVIGVPVVIVIFRVFVSASSSFSVFVFWATTPLLVFCRLPKERQSALMFPFHSGHKLACRVCRVPPFKGQTISTAVLIRYSFFRGRWDKYRCGQESMNIRRNP